MTLFLLFLYQMALVDESGLCRGNRLANCPSYALKLLISSDAVLNRNRPWAQSLIVDDDYETLLFPVDVVFNTQSLFCYIL
jgi:hypothetical protein